jgi:hypothetical protein
MTMTSTTDSVLQGWFAGRVPGDWFAGPPMVLHDRDEIVVIGVLTEPAVADPADDEARAAARSARVSGFREDTRERRMQIADEAETRFTRKVAWGVRCGDDEILFTTLSVPVMTRLRLDERRVLDTLVDAGVARSRSHALAWCVRLVRDHESSWIEQLRDALVHVKQARDDGPRPR